MASQRHRTPYHLQLPAQRRPFRVPPGRPGEGGRGGAYGAERMTEGTMTRSPGMWVDHQQIAASGGEAMVVENPATEETVGCVPRGRAADVATAVAAARRAHAQWRRVPGLDKARYLHDIAARMRDMHRELAEIMTLEGGKPMIENLDEIDWTAACFDYYAEIGRHSRGNS